MMHMCAYVAIGKRIRRQATFSKKKAKRSRESEGSWHGEDKERETVGQLVGTEDVKVRR